VVVLLVVATAPAVTTRLYASDEVQYYVYLRSLWFDQDVSFENEYRHLYEAGIARSEGFKETLLERTTATGRRLNFATIGCAILWAPFYAAGDLWAHVARWLGSSVPTDGYSSPYIAAVCYASAVYGWLALLLSAMAARHVVRASGGQSRAIGIPLLVFAGTPLVFYMYVAPPFAHATSAFAVSALTLAWLRVRRRWSPGGTALVGTLAALVVLVREQDAFLLIGPAVDFARTWLHARWTSGQADPNQAAGDATRARLLVSACLGALAFGATWLPQGLAYVALNGRVGPSPLLTRKMAWWSPHAGAVLFSPEHGLLWWTPLVALAIAGLVLLVAKPGETGAEPSTDVNPRLVSLGFVPATRTDTRAVGVGLLAMLAGHLYVTGCVASWTLAGAFGQRRFVAVTPLIVIGLTVLAARVRVRAARLALGMTLAVCAWWNLGLMVQFGAGMMDRQRLEIGRNARTTFLELPRAMPLLVYRYLFDRQRFYRPSPPGR
jgi:hypothetical protein